jgi:hypothetical protein
LVEYEPLIPHFEDVEETQDTDEHDGTRPILKAMDGDKSIVPKFRPPMLTKPPLVKGRLSGRIAVSNGASKLNKAMELVTVPPTFSANRSAYEVPKKLY